jgi:hypothetical protein
VVVGWGWVEMKGGIRWGVGVWWGVGGCVLEDGIGCGLWVG